MGSKICSDNNLLLSRHMPWVITWGRLSVTLLCTNTSSDPKVLVHNNVTLSFQGSLLVFCQGKRSPFCHSSFTAHAPALPLCLCLISFRSTKWIMLNWLMSLSYIANKNT